MQRLRSLWWIPCLVLVAACGGGGGGGTPATLDWVILAFLDGDGDREWQAVTNLAQLEESDTTGSSVEIIAFLDRHPNPSGGGYFSVDIPTVGGSDWADTRWGRVTYDGLPSSYASTLQLYSTVKPDVSMGHPSVLNTFITQAMALAPAKHYALIIFDHGAPYGIAWDETQHDDFLSTSELSAVLDAVPFIDVVVLDACNMQHIEVASEMVGEVGYLLASQQPRWGKPLGSNIYYNRSIDWLIANPTATPLAFARRLLLDDKHAEAYSGNASVVSIAGIPALNSAIDTFADAALTHASVLDWAVLAGLQTAATKYHSSAYRDLREYMGAVESSPALPTPIRTAAKTVYDLLAPVTGSVVMEKEGIGTGLSIVLPPSASSIPNWYTAHGFDFLDSSSAVGTSWLDYLRKLPAPAEPWVAAFLDGLTDVLPDGPPDAPLIGPQGHVSWVDSQIEDPTDLDFLRFEVGPGGDVQSTLYAEVVGDQAGGVMPVLTVRSEGGTILAEATADPGGAARIENLLLSEGTHYLVVSAGPPPPATAATGEEGTGRYTLRCLCGDPATVAPRLVLSHTEIDFGTVPVGTWTTRTLELSNPGGSPLRIEALHLPPGSAFLAPYEQLALPLVVGAGTTTAIRIGVRPDEPGALEAPLEIESSAPGAPFQVLPLFANAD